MQGDVRRRPEDVLRDVPTVWPVFDAMPAAPFSSHPSIYDGLWRDQTRTPVLFGGWVVLGTALEAMVNPVDRRPAMSPYGPATHPNSRGHLRTSCPSTIVRGVRSFRPDICGAGSLRRRYLS